MRKEEVIISRALSTMALMIGAHALIYDETLLSRNLKDFRRIPNLRIESY